MRDQYDCSTELQGDMCRMCLTHCIAHDIPYGVTNQLTNYIANSITHGVAYNIADHITYRCADSGANDSADRMCRLGTAVWHQLPGYIWSYSMHSISITGTM